MPFDKEFGYRVVDVLKKVAARHGASPAQVALAWVLSRPEVSSVIIAGRTAEQLEGNIRATDLQLSDEDLRLLDAVSDPGVPYPKWMVLQLDAAEDPRAKILYPNVTRGAVRGRTSAAHDGSADQGLERFSPGFIDTPGLTELLACLLTFWPAGTSVPANHRKHTSFLS